MKEVHVGGSASFGGAAEPGSTQAIGSNAAEGSRRWGMGQAGASAE